MKRDISGLKNKTYDILVIGGGVYGASIAREAVLRGVSAALMDKGDFCGATSANSLKIIHGGLRYLQKLDVVRTRESAREQRIMMDIAPHLVHPLPCVMPTRRNLMKSRLAMAAGLLLHEILKYPFGRSGDPEKRMPAGRVISKERCLSIARGISSGDVTGGAMWHDAIACNTERLVVDVVRSAVLAGASAANYLSMTGFLEADGAVCGVRALDMVTGDEVEIRSRLVINSAGPWANEILSFLKRSVTMPVAGLALGMNFILKKQIFSEYAVGIPVAGEEGRNERLLFFVPWRNVTMAGTYYRSHEGRPDEKKVTAGDIELFLADLNLACPEAGLTRGDIAMIHAGLIPAVRSEKSVRDPDLAEHYTIVDHAKRDGIGGLLSVSGVKYTTARDVAVKAVNIAVRKLGMDCPPSASGRLVLPGGDIKEFNGFLSHAGLGDVDPQLVYNYGTEYKSVIDLSGDNKDTLQGEVAFALRHEMAQTLADVVLRRTGLAAHGVPDDAVLQECAGIMADAAGWDTDRVRDEISGVKSSLALP